MKYSKSEKVSEFTWQRQKIIFNKKPKFIDKSIDIIVLRKDGDIENPLDHPNISIVDCNDPLPELDLAFVHVDTGSVAMPETRDLRIKSLTWAAQNVVAGGYLFTIGYSDYVLSSLKFDVIKYLESQNFECIPASTLVDSNIVEFFKKKNNFDLAMEVIAKKLPVV
jgi:hypothetical protein